MSGSRNRDLPFFLSTPALIVQSIMGHFAAFFWSVFIAFFLGLSSASALSPHIHWEKIETPHFTVIFDSQHRELGKLYAKFAEEAFLAVSPVFGQWPEKTVLLIDDSNDLANGSATGVPYPLIMSYPVLPTALDSISDYGNWGVELITHEYTHILNFEPATGVMKPLRYIFGSIVRPNMLLPRWYSEGLAVEMETRYSRFGRLRSANYLSIMRAMLLDRSIWKEDISRINEVSIPDWPGGMRPYLMGALLMDEVVRRGGPSMIGDLNLAYSRRIPFFIEGPIRSRLGLDYTGLLQKTYERAAMLAETQLALIHDGGKLESQAFEQKGYFLHGAVVSPDGTKLATIGKRHNLDSYVSIIERSGDGNSFRTSEAAKPATDGTVINRLSWLPDSSALIHDGIDTSNRYNEYSELWRYDLASRKDTRLSRGLRAREPVVSTDARAIAFVQSIPGSTRLAATAIDGTNLVVLYQPPPLTRISRPEFLSPTEIIFTEKRDDGDESLRVLRIETGPAGLKPLGEPRSVLSTFKPAHFPRLTKEGLIFVSDRSGVANIYLADKELANARALTNSETRTLTADIDPVTRDLLYTELLGDRAALKLAPKSSWSKMPPAPPRVGSIVDTSWPEWTRPQIKDTSELDKVEEYSPWWYLLPRYWLPYAYVAPGVTYVSASTSANDPTNRHSYSLSAAYDSQTNSGSLFGSYVNQTTDVPVTIAGSNYYESIYGSSQPRQSANYGASGSFFIPKLNNNWRGSLGWIYSDSSIGSLTLRRNGVDSTLRYTNVKMRGYEVSPEKGGTFGVGYARYLPGMSDFEYDVTTLNIAKYLSGWILPERHSVSLQVNASLAPRLDNPLFGTSTYSGNYQTLPGLRNFVMRGYNSGVFLGRNLAIASAEYHFPFLYSYRGYKTWPLFFQRWHGDVFADAITLDGWFYNYDSRRYQDTPFGKPFYGTGIEAKLDATIAYHIPIQFTFGLYYGTDSRANPNGVFPFITFGM